MDIKKLGELVVARIAAKRKEDEASTERRKLDADIADLFREDMQAQGKTTGSVGRRLEDIGVRPVCTFGQSRKFTTGYDALPDWLRAVAKPKYEVDSKAFAALTDEQKLEASKFIETKDDTPSIKVEVL